MSVLEVSLDWGVDSKGYKFEDYGNEKTIIGSGGILKKTRPHFESAITAFEKVQSQSDLLKFVTNYGLLNEPSYEKSYGKVRVNAKSLKPIPGWRPIIGEGVVEHLETASRIREFRSWIAKGGYASKILSDWIDERLLNAKHGEIEMVLDEGRFKLRLRANSLLDGMLLQLATRTTIGTKIRICRHCAIPFEVGSGTGRRSDAIFCSESHKIASHSLKRSNASKTR
jgi:hypothetical protein